MSFDPDIHHRRSIRLRGFEYSATGAYFVTICVQGKACLFGDIAAGEQILNEAGRMVARIWHGLSGKFPTVTLDRAIIMPDHFHGIIVLHSGPITTTDTRPNSVGADPCVCPSANSHPGLWNLGGHTGPGDLGGHTGPGDLGGHTGPGDLGGHTGPPLHRVVQWFKTMTTNAYIRGVNDHGWPPFPGRLWQRNYYERIIRNERELEHLRGYIADNPRRFPP